MEDIADKIKKETGEMGRAVREKTLTYVTAGLGLVAGLAWNDAIRGLIEYLFPLTENTVIAKLVYAVLVTAVIALTLVYLERFLKRRDS